MSLSSTNEKALNDLVVDVHDLSLVYRVKTGNLQVLDGVNFSIGKNKLVAVVGESGCGKSTLALSIIGLLTIPPAQITSGKVLYKGVNLLELDEKEMLNYRGTEIGMIFQEPLSSLNPVYTIGDQVAEAIAVRASRLARSQKEVYSYDKPVLKHSPWHKTTLRFKRRGYRDNVIETLRMVRIHDPEYMVDRYPYELSGGMRQRVCIAMALSEKPSLLIADEPTSAIDVTTQAEVLRLMRELMDEVKMSILLITHDLAVASQTADEIAVMYAGDIVEQADVYELFSQPLHPYTKALIACVPSGFKDEAKLKSIGGTLPDLRSLPKGCKFAARCADAKKTCLENRPRLVQVSKNHRVACNLE